MRFLIPVFPDEVGFDNRFGRNDKCYQVDRTRQCASNPVYNTRQRSDGKAITQAPLVRFYNHILRNFPKSRYRVRKTVRELVPYALDVIMGHGGLRRNE